MTQESLFEPAAKTTGANGEPTANLESLGGIVRQCCKCRLAETRANVVFGEGNPKARLFVIGEAPGADEDAQGRPFVGRSGQLLEKILSATGFERNEVYIGNIIKCRPPQNRNPLPDEIECCKPWLMQQLEIIKPNIILLLGRVAANTILDNKLSMGAMRNKLIGWNGFDCFVTYHPAALLRNPNWKRPCWEDMKLLKAHYDAICPDGGAAASEAAMNHMMTQRK